MALVRESPVPGSGEPVERTPTSAVDAFDADVPASEHRDEVWALGLTFEVDFAEDNFYGLGLLGFGGASERSLEGTQKRATVLVCAARDVRSRCLS